MFRVSFGHNLAVDTAKKVINVAEKEVSTADPVTTAGEDFNKIQKCKNHKGQRVVIGEQSESTTKTRPQQLPSKDKGKGIMEEPGKPTKKKDQIRLDEELAFSYRLKKSVYKEMKRVNTFVDMDTELVEEKGKIGYFQIIRADGSSKRYSSTIQMLKSFDMEDLETLWKLVKAKHESTMQKKMNRVLWEEYIFYYFNLCISMLVEKKLSFYTYNNHRYSEEEASADH
ncbi:hypothetical protein Tco_0408051 [Tanacetum coccineum]